jgi:hypothetical protein
VKDLDITDKIWLYTIKNLRGVEALGNVLGLRNYLKFERTAPWRPP